jgi:histone demethylase JARID1
MADKFYETWCSQHYGDTVPTREQLANDYWRLVDTQKEKAFVEYGNDIDTKMFGSGFPENDSSNNEGVEPHDSNDMFSENYYKRTGWNLNNIAGQEGSVLKHLQTPINGINVPWLYIGMLFTTFCWHNEDNYLYSINYSHFGAVKQWYGVPGIEAKLFEKVMKEFLWESFKESPDLLHHMTTQLSPSLLMKNRVPVCKLSQEAKTFVITFPKAFHSGFSYGFNCGEAVNFATIDWLLYGGEAEERYRTVNRGTVFSHHRLLFTLLNHKDEIISPQSRKELALEIFRVVDEELGARPEILEQGIRDISDKVHLPPNNFEVIDEKSSTYDEMRCCCVCNHVCIFSAIACECDKEKIACIRHHNLMCKCPKIKKYLLSWAKAEFLESLYNEMKGALKGKNDFVSEKVKDEQ